MIINKFFLKPPSYDDNYKTFKIIKIISSFNLLWFMTEPKVYPKYCKSKVGKLISISIIINFNTKILTNLLKQLHSLDYIIK